MFLLAAVHGFQETLATRFLACLAESKRNHMGCAGPCHLENSAWKPCQPYGQT